MVFEGVARIESYVISDLTLYVKGRSDRTHARCICARRGYGGGADARSVAHIAQAQECERESGGSAGQFAQFSTASYL